MNAVKIYMRTAFLIKISSIVSHIFKTVNFRNIFVMCNQYGEVTCGRAQHTLHLGDLACRNLRYISSTRFQWFGLDNFLGF